MTLNIESIIESITNYPINVIIVQQISFYGMKAYSYAVSNSAHINRYFEALENFEKLVFV